MIDALIIAFVVAGVAIAIRSIAKSFAGGKCSGCASSSSCGKGAHGATSCPMCESTVADMNAAVAERLSAGKAERA